MIEGNIKHAEETMVYFYIGETVHPYGEKYEYLHAHISPDQKDIKIDVVQVEEDDSVNHVRIDVEGDKGTTHLYMSGEQFKKLIETGMQHLRKL